MSKVPKKFPNFFVSMPFLSSWLRVLKTLQKENIRCTGGCFEEINALFWKSHNFESTTLGWQKFQSFRFSRFLCKFRLIFFLVSWLGCRLGFCEEQIFFLWNKSQTVENLSNKSLISNILKCYSFCSFSFTFAHFSSFLGIQGSTRSKTN